MRRQNPHAQTMQKWRVRRWQCKANGVVINLLDCNVAPATVELRVRASILDGCKGIQNIVGIQRCAIVPADVFVKRHGIHFAAAVESIVLYQLWLWDAASILNK